VYGAAVITLITVQNTTTVSRVETLDPELVSAQIAAVIEDLPPHAAKTGALGNAAVVEAVASYAIPCPLVVDPVMISKHGAWLVDVEARAALRNKLLPKAALVTPNLDEAADLAGIPVTNVDQMREAAIRIAQLGPRSVLSSVLIKGGHLDGDAVDILFHEGAFTEFRSPRIDTRHTHGTGCTYSAAITAFLARGFGMVEAVARAKRFIDEAIRTNPGLGAGSGPVNHWVNVD
jgi:hydroxymethylpyrimidine/phosphomethylpyrimidine kinase